MADPLPLTAVPPGWIQRADGQLVDLLVDEAEQTRPLPLPAPRPAAPHLTRHGRRCGCGRCTHVPRHARRATFTVRYRAALRRRLAIQGGPA